MALPQSISQEWQELSDLTIYEAALWMVIETDPLDHEFDLEHNENYSNYYESTHGGAAAVQTKCAILISAVREGSIKSAPIQQSPGYPITYATYISKLSWIDWCRIKNYTALSNLFSQYNYINVPTTSAPSPTLVVVNPAAISSLIPAALETTASAPSVNTKKVRTHKLNRNILDAAIDEAINQAGNMELADVFLKLKEMAMSSYSPFTGVIGNKTLSYTNDSNVIKKFSKNALGKRLVIRRNNTS